MKIAPIVYVSFARKYGPWSSRRAGPNRGLVGFGSAEMNFQSQTHRHCKFSAAAQPSTTTFDPIDPLNERVEHCMLTVLLVRHGETVHNVAKLYAGITDSEYLLALRTFSDLRLTVHGMNQATSLGEALKHEPVTHVFSSDLIRACRTASAVAQHHPHVSVVPTTRLRERDFGDLEGKPWRTTWSLTKYGESGTAMRERAVSAWHWVLQETNVFEDATNLFIVLVSHGVFLGSLFTAICGFYNAQTPPNIFWNNTAYLKFVVIPSHNPVFKVECVNNTRHLTAVQRQKGGVGSSKFDESQKTMKDFFVPSPKKLGPKSGKSPSLTMVLFPPF